MYRTLLTILFVGAGTAAPSDNSDITYVKIQPMANQDAPLPHPRLSSFRESRIENIPLTIRGYNVDNENESGNIRHIRSESDEYTTFSPHDSDEATDTTETATESTERTSYEEKIDSIDYEVGKKPLSPRFYSKLSYFEKSNYDSALSTNLVDNRTNKRRFRSKCRCERIWNCPKLQITIPRCPEEYFMCCF